MERRGWEMGGREEEETWLRDKDGNGGAVCWVKGVMGCGVGAGLRRVG